MIIKILNKIKGKLKIEKIDFVKNKTFSKIYGNIYYPIYNTSTLIENDKPVIYNKNGEQMDVWFIRDFHSAHCPYRESSKYFIWDRYDFGLETHFYSHKALLETMGKPVHKYGLFIESEAIVPDDYLIFQKNKGLENDFDSIFTYSEKILNSVSNSKFFPFCATITYGKSKNCSIKIHEDNYKNKNKNISMICSDKRLCYMHEIRYCFATAALNSEKVDIFGKFNNGKYLQFKEESLYNYRYQIVVENDLQPYYFTEKILDCFASMTIPIYLGATKISKFFNQNGIIFININDYNNLDKIILKCNEKTYEELLPAVIDNYNKCLNYLNINDKFYEDYFR